MILDNIIAKKQVMLPDIVKRFNYKYKDSVKSSKKRANFYDAISKTELSIIGEIKKASPSKGIIKKDFNPTGLSKEYGNHVDAISVLTEEHFFMGSLDYLKDIHDTVDLPLLCKDFIIDKIQIDMAYELGASCILLIAAILTDNQLNDYINYANSLNLDSLVEVHSEEELTRVLATDAKIIGINNRNLNNFKVDLNTTIQLSNKIPQDRLIISESGISTAEDISLLSSNGRIDAVLVGESFMRSDNIANHAKELRDGYKGKN